MKHLLTNTKRGNRRYQEGKSIDTKRGKQTTPRVGKHVIPREGKQENQEWEQVIPRGVNR
jgi:hypothetical protein